MLAGPIFGHSGDKQFLTSSSSSNNRNSNNYNTSSSYRNQNNQTGSNPDLQNAFKFAVSTNSGVKTNNSTTFTSKNNISGESRNDNSFSPGPASSCIQHNNRRPLKPVHLHAPVYREVPIVSRTQPLHSTTSLTDNWELSMSHEPALVRKYQPFNIPPAFFNSKLSKSNKATSVSMSSLFSFNREPRQDSDKERRASHEKLRFFGDFDELLNAKGEWLENCDRFLRSVSRVEKDNSAQNVPPPPPPKPISTKPLLTPQPPRPSYGRSLSEGPASASVDNSPALSTLTRAKSFMPHSRIASNDSVISMVRHTNLLSRIPPRRTSDSKLAEKFKRNSLISEEERTESLEKMSEGSFLRRAFDGDRDAGSRVRNSPFRRGSCDILHSTQFNEPRQRPSGSPPLLSLKQLSLPSKSPGAVAQHKNSNNGRGSKESLPYSVTSSTERAEKKPLTGTTSPTRYNPVLLVIPRISVASSKKTQKTISTSALKRSPSKTSITYWEDFVDPAEPSKVKICDVNLERTNNRSNSDMSADWVYSSGRCDTEPERLMDEKSKPRQPATQVHTPSRNRAFSTARGAIGSSSPIIGAIHNEMDFEDSLRSASVNSALNELNVTLKEMELGAKVPNSSSSSKKKKGGTTDNNCVMC